MLIKSTLKKSKQSQMINVENVIYLLPETIDHITSGRKLLTSVEYSNIELINKLIF